MMVLIAQVASLFTVPGLAAAGAVLVAIPIAIHLLSRFRRKRQAWAAMRFVWEAYRRHRRRLQMEQWLLLVVRCLIVVVLGLALAGPLLTGCSERLRAAGLLPGASRTVHVVIDNSLSSRAEAAGGAPRFEALRETALAVIGGAGAGDDVVVWPTSGVDGSALGGGSGPSSRAPGGRLAAMTPGYGGAGVDDALTRVAAAIEALGDESARRQVVVLVSDWSRSSVDPQLSPPVLPGRSEGPGMGVFVSRPLPGAANVQVMSVTPRRRVVVAGPDGGASVPIEVRLRRFGASDSQQVWDLRLELLDARGRGIVETRRPVRFAPGQSVVTLNESLHVPAAVMRGLSGRQPVAVRAVLGGGPPGSENALAEDDHRYAAVVLRSRLRVGLMTTPDAGGDGSAARLTARRWLALALSPRGGVGGGPIEVTPVAAADLGVPDAAALAGLDVVMVTRPDRLSKAAWANLAGFARGGGLVWLVTPADGASAMWAQSMRSAFDLDWQVAIEPAEVGGADGGVRAVLDEAPPALSMLASDWEALLRPVRVTRWLPLWVPRREAWVALNVGGAVGEPEEPGPSSGTRQDRHGGREGGASAAALLAYHGYGRGGVLLLSAALDVAWTNLPTKPLFVPLVHEALRGVVGRAPSAGLGVDELAARGLEGLSRVPLAPEEGASDDDAGGRIRPGVYVDASTGALVPVNLDAGAADTRSLDDAALAGWLDGLGPWRFLDLSDPAAALRAAGDAAPSLGWPLLWLVLALVLLETVLARTLSHAKAGHPRGLTGVVMGRLRRFRDASPQGRRGAA